MLAALPLHHDVDEASQPASRLVKLGGNDTIIDPDLLALVVGLWNPLSDF